MHFGLGMQDTKYYLANIDPSNNFIIEPTEHTNIFDQLLVLLDYGDDVMEILFPIHIDYEPFAVIRYSFN